MRNFNYIIILTFILFVPLLAQTVITGDLNEDNLADTLIYSKPNEDNEVYFKIKLSSSTTPNKTIKTFNYQLSEENVSVSIPVQASIRIIEGGSTGSSIKYYYYYQFNPKFQNWFLAKQIEYNSNSSSGNFANPIIKVEYADGTIGIDGEKISPEQANQMSKNSRVLKFQNEFNIMNDTLKSIFKTKSYGKIPIEYFDNIRIAELLTNVRVTSDNVEKYNNIAFILGLNSKGLYSSILILKNVIDAVPTRTVAYLNLADAYWGIDDKTSAKEAYQTYVNLMKMDGKEKNIPQRVYERTKQ